VPVKASACNQLAIIDPYDWSTILLLSRICGVSEREDGNPVEAGEISAQPDIGKLALPETAAPPLSPSEIPPVQAPKERLAAPEVAEAEVIMLPVKFAAFLASTATRFHERSLALPSAGRRAAAVALVVLIAGASAVAGAVFNPNAATSAADKHAQAEQVRAVRQSVARIESELLALRGNIDRTAKLAASHAGKTGDRLDRIEKAQAEPAMRLAKLADSVEKLRTAPPATVPAAVVAAAPPPPVAAAAVTAAVAPPAALAKEVTGSIAAQASIAPTKPEVTAQPAIVEGWVLRDAEKGAALIQGRNGLFEVLAGDTIPGVGRVEAVRRQDGKWVVVTAKGLIVPR